MADPSDFPGVRGRKKRGPRPNSENWEHRQRHIQVAYCRLVLKRSAKWTMAHYGVSRRTVIYWTNAALKYDDPEARVLREKLGLETP